MDKEIGDCYNNSRHYLLVLPPQLVVQLSLLKEQLLRLGFQARYLITICVQQLGEILVSVRVAVQLPLLSFLGEERVIVG